MKKYMYYLYAVLGHCLPIVKELNFFRELLRMS